MDLKLLKLLQNNNTPLIITVEEKEKKSDDHQGQRSALKNKVGTSSSISRKP